MKFIPNFYAIEFALSSWAIWWGIALSMPGTTFNSTPSYLAMANIASETGWALIIFSVGIFQFLAMVLDRKRLKLISLQCSSSLWLFIGAMFVMSDLQNNLISTASGTYLIISCLSMWLYVKVSRE